MKWADKIKAGVADVAGDLSASLTKLYAVAKDTFGVKYTDAQATASAAKIAAVIPKVRALLAQELDDIPGVPTILADLGAQMVGRLLDAGLAGGLEMAKNVNGND